LNFQNLLKVFFILLFGGFYIIINLYFFGNNFIICENTDHKFRKNLLIGSGVIIVGLGIITYVQVKNMLAGIQHMEKKRFLLELDNQNSQILVEYSNIFNNRDLQLDRHLNTIAHKVDIDKPVLIKKVLDISIIKSDFIHIFKTPALVYNPRYINFFADVCLKQKLVLAQLKEVTTAYQQLSKELVEIGSINVSTAVDRNRLVIFRNNCKILNSLMDEYVKVTMNLGDAALTATLGIPASGSAMGFKLNPNNSLYKDYYLPELLVLSGDKITVREQFIVYNIEKSIFRDFLPSFIFVRDVSVVGFYCIGYVLGMFTSFVNPIPSEYAFHSWKRLLYREKESISFLSFYEKNSFHKLQDWYAKK
jgi:hypothetical protein